MKQFSNFCCVLWRRHPLRSLGLLKFIAWIGFGCVTNGPSGSPIAHADEVSIHIMGDVPYQAAEYEKLAQDVKKMDADAIFAIHVGDIKRGVTPCAERIYERVSAILRTSSIPVFSLPGDNEWNDCPRPSPAWELWKRYFLRLDQNWDNQLRVFRSMEREENFSVVHGGVLFIGINIVGGKVHDAEEWRLRHRQNMQWVKRNLEQFGDESRALVLLGHALPMQKHLDFFGPLTVSIAEWGKPTLYVHGDGHRWIQDRPFPNAPNLMRVQVDQGGIAPPLKLTISDDLDAPFRLDRRLLVESE